MPNQVSKYLPSFSQLSWNIYLRLPPDTAPPLPASDPHLVIALTWGSAPIGALSKYANHYTELYPSSRILVLSTYFYEFFIHRFPSRFHSTIGPAVSTVREVVDTASASSEKPRILAHVFSNGGCFKLVRLSAAYQEATGSLLPLSGLIFDSAPGIGRFWRSFAAFSFVFPRTVILYQLGMAITFVYLVFWRILSMLKPGGGAWTRGIYDKLNDGEVIPRSTPRMYVYSKADYLIDWKDIEGHAETAKKAFEGKVETKEFEGSGHVAHMRKYPDQYWTMVTEFWRRSSIEKRGR